MKTVIIQNNEEVVKEVEFLTLAQPKVSDKVIQVLLFLTFLAIWTNSI